MKLHTRTSSAGMNKITGSLTIPPQNDFGYVGLKPAVYYHSDSNGLVDSQYGIVYNALDCKFTKDNKIVNTTGETYNTRKLGWLYGDPVWIK